MEIVPGVHKVDGTSGGNVYLLVDDDLTLVDTGLPGNGPTIFRYIRHLGRDPQDLTRVVLTHGHPDHTSTVAWLKAHIGAMVTVHPGDVGGDTDGRRWVRYISQPVAFERKIPFFHRVPFDAVFGADDVLPVLGGLRVLHTPGHTPGSVCFHLPEHGVLLTGDTLLGKGRMFSRPLPLPGYDSDLYWHSLNLISRLEFDVACGGHGVPVTETASRLLRSMMDMGAMDSYLGNLRHRFLVSIGAR